MLIGNISHKMKDLIISISCIGIFIPKCRQMRTVFKKKQKITNLKKKKKKYKILYINCSIFDQFFFSFILFFNV